MPESLEDLKHFEIDPTRGFLPASDPLTELPDAFGVWDEVAAELPRLLLTGRVRAIIESLPELDADALRDDGELRRAMLVLSYMGHAYVWGEHPAAPHVPRSIARPWCRVAERLGRPPVLSYASYALDNWRLYDPDGPVQLGNIALLQNFLGGADEDWFIGVHIDIEYRAADLLREVGPIVDSAAFDRADRLQIGLSNVATAMQQIVAVLRRMPEHCDPYIYYQRVRPYIHGWLNHPALPDGLIYEDVEAFDGQPQQLRGETGAQSGIVPTLDALLQVNHADDPLRAYLLEMRDYMPPAHHRWLKAVEAQSTVRAYIQRDSTPAELRELYDECLHWLEAFRSIHLEYAAVYIYRQAQHGVANPKVVGTGGTPFMPYLKKHRDETAEQRLGVESES